MTSGRGRGGDGRSGFTVDRHGGGGRYVGRPIGRSRQAVTNVGVAVSSVVLIVSVGGKI